MKKTIGYLVVFVGLIAVSAWLFLSDQKPSEEEQRAFQTPEIGELSRIELKDRAGNFTVLSKIDEKWMVDESFPVSKITLNDLLYALEHMEAAYPAPAPAVDNVLTQMVSNATKVSLYKNGKKKPFKVFVVGGPNHDQDGTYMLMEIDGEAADRPYLVKLPGFKGYVTYRFSAIRNFWIGTQFTKLLAEEIKSVSLEYFQEDTEQSFTLSRKEGEFSLLKDNELVDKDSVNTEMAEAYFNAFMDLSFERYLDSLPKQDSVLKHMHFADLSLKLNEGDERKVSIYFKPYPKQENLPLDELGKAKTIDPDKLYLYDHGSQAYYTIQYYTFGKLFLKADQLKK